MGEGDGYVSEDGGGVGVDRGDDDDGHDGVPDNAATTSG